MDDAQVPAARPVSSGCLRGRHSRSLALAVPLRVVYCRNNERVISVVLVFLSLCLSVLGFRFLLFAKQEPSFSPSLCHSLLLGFGLVVAVCASRTIGLVASEPGAGFSSPVNLVSSQPA